MALPDLLRLADAALGGASNPALPEDLVRIVVEETSSRIGVLRDGQRVVASWPRGVTRRIEEATEGWMSLEVGGDDSAWVLRLLQPERLDEFVLGATRLALRAWDLREELRRTRFDERFHLWELEAIRSIATSIGGILDSSRLADELVGHLVALLGVRSVQLYLGSGAEGAELVAGFGPEVIDAAVRERAWSSGLYSDEIVAVPLQTDGGLVGLLVAAHKEARAGTEPFAANDVRLLELFAIQVTVAMEYARLSRESLERERLKGELEVAAAIQSHLHPQRFPDFPCMRIAGRSSPSRQVAGDTYDVVLENDRLLVTVTDVSGKGVGAGMIASGVHAGVRLLASDDVPLDELARRLNRYLAQTTADNRFATFALVRLATDGSFEAVNAGHCPILIRRAEGRIESIDSSGLPLGILPGAAHVRQAGRLDRGDLLVLYTDGLSEAENPAEEEFGTQRVVDTVAALGGVSAETACERLMAEVHRFADGKPLHDDATLLVVERLISE